MFLTWVIIIALAIAANGAILASWQEGSFSAIATAWANFATWVFIALIVWIFYWIWKKWDNSDQK